MAFWDNKKILVVDDEEGIRELVASELEFNGATCLQAENGKVAFDLYKANKFDAVVSDIRMPEGDGLYFLDKIQEEKLDPCVMIFMTGFSDVPIEEIYDRGVEAVIAKPFRLDQLVSTLELAMSVPRSTWRKSPRVVSVLDIEIQWQGLEASVHTKTFNMGRGGLFIQLRDDFPQLGTSVQFKLTYLSEGVQKVMEGELVVRWVRSQQGNGYPPGFGGEFVNLSESDRDIVVQMSGLVNTKTFIPKK